MKHERGMVWVAWFWIMGNASQSKDWWTFGAFAIMAALIGLNYLLDLILDTMKLKAGLRR